MADEPARDLLTAVAPRVLDLRAEFEAQLRAIARLEHQLTRAVAGRDPGNRALTDAVRRALTEMATNNMNIREVLTDLATQVSPSDSAR